MPNPHGTSIAEKSGRFKLQRDSGLTNPTAERAAIEVREVLQRVHPDPAIDEGLKILRDFAVIDIREVDVEGVGSQVLRIKRSSFELGIGLRRAVAAQDTDLVLAVFP